LWIFVFNNSKCCSTPPSSRLLIGLSGIPASGKSTLADLIVQRTNQLLEQASYSSDDQNEVSTRAITVGLDGWHLTRAQLDAFPGDEAQLAHDKRGAHWTFDSSAYVAFIHSLRQTVTTTSAVITAPSFDHAVKDPTPEAIRIMPHHRIILIEGLYTFLSIEPWCQGGKLLDERWFVDVDILEARRRLIARHVVTGVAKDWEEAAARADTNDMPSMHFRTFEPRMTTQFHLI
jgi:pantothenate kinase